jgi:hypothetical protein
MRLVTHSEREARVRRKEKADIVMKMLRLVTTRRNLMHVNIKWRVGEDSNLPEAALFPNLPKRHRKQIGIAVSMTSWLQPLVELAVMSQ